jgi:hypothetical protein
MHPENQSHKTLPTLPLHLQLKNNHDLKGPGKKKAGREEERWYGGKIAVNIAESCCSCHRPNFSLISKARAGNIKQKVNQLMSNLL